MWHIRDGATDDHVELQVTHGPDGTMQTVAVAASVDVLVDVLSEGR